MSFSRPLKATFSRVPRVLPMVTSPPELGVEIDWEITPSTGKVVSHIRQNDYDIFEYSIAGYITALQSGVAQRLGWTALPIFLSRPIGMFENFVTNVDSGIESFADLSGKKIGILEYRMTAGVWLRAILRQLYGIEPTSMQWVNSHVMSESYMAELGAPDTLAEGLVIEDRTTPDLASQVAAGDLDAAFADPGAGLDDPNLRRPFEASATVQLFAQMAKSMGATPANHLVVVKREVLDSDAGLAVGLYQAFEAAKQQAYVDALASAAAYLWAPKVEFQHQAELFGKDPYPSGFSANKDMLALMIAQMKYDGQLAGDVTPEEMFPEALLDS
jgi:4,5-dihydroxyphthalate decarboxylase